MQGFGAIKVLSPDRRACGRRHGGQASLRSTAMNEQALTNLEVLGRNWAQTVTSVVWGQWAMLDAGLQAAQRVLATASPAGRRREVGAGEPEAVVRHAMERMRKGLASPREIYQAPYRNRIDWSQFPDWARPCDPELFEGTGHEG